MKNYPHITFNEFAKLETPIIASYEDRNVKYFLYLEKMWSEKRSPKSENCMLSYESRFQYHKYNFKKNLDVYLGQPNKGAIGNEPFLRSLFITENSKEATTYKKEIIKNLFTTKQMKWKKSLI